MSSRLLVTVLALILGLVATACADGAGDLAAPVPTQEPTMAPTPSPAAGEAMAAVDAHGHDTVEAAAPMTVDIDVKRDAVGGFNVHVLPDGFAFAPELASTEHVNGVGHAHVYVDGEKIGRVYTDWFHLPPMAKGAHEIEVTLNANDHSAYVVDRAPVASTVSVKAPAPAEGHHHAEAQEADARMAVAIEVTEDPMSGWNLHLATEGFRFAPELASTEHVDGVGHAHLYIDGEKIGRLYGRWAHINQPLTQGAHDIEVVLSTNHHADYAVDGEPVSARARLHVTADDAAADVPMKDPSTAASEVHGH